MWGRLWGFGVCGGGGGEEGRQTFTPPKTWRGYKGGGEGG